MQLFVKHGEQSSAVIDIPSTNILLKDALSNINNIFNDNDSYVTCHGRVLNTDTAVSDLNLHHNSTVEIHTAASRVLGGAQLGKAVKGRSKDKGSKKTTSSNSTATTSEERLLQERIKKMEYLEYQKKVQSAAKSSLKQWMENEVSNSKMNKLKIQNQWRKIMRLAKVESLRTEIEILSQNHERDVDRRDAILQMLDRDLAEAEEQYQMALGSHFANIDKLIDHQDARLLSLEQAFEKDLATLETEFGIEAKAIRDAHEKEKRTLEDIQARVAADEEEAAADAKQEHEQVREEIRNKNLEDINVLRITLDGNIEELEQHFETAHLNYLQNTDQRTSDFKYLTAKDQDLSKDIEYKIRKIERLTSAISHWKTKISQNVKECTDRNNALSLEKNNVATHFTALKAKMNTFRSNQSKKLVTLSSTAMDVKQSLNNSLESATRIIKLAELAHKYESESERILPFGEEISQEEELERADDDVVESHQPCGMLHERIVPEYNYLDRFYKRYNKVLLEEIEATKEKERLERENQELQDILKQYLDGITVTEDLMSGQDRNDNNPLMVINGRIQLNNKQATKGGGEAAPPVIMDANHIQHTYQMSRK